jgi:hypothetical protein
MPDRRRGKAEDREKREDLAFIIPLFGIVLLTPLVANRFVVRKLAFGVPLEIAYLFAVWLLLVVGAVCLAFWLPPSRGAVESMEDDVDGGERSGSQ